MIRLQLLGILLLAASVALGATVPKKKHASSYQVPRPPLVGLHIGMSADSVELIMHKIALRSRMLHVDSLSLLESDSVRVFGEPAYVRVDLLHNKVRTLVVNFHPLSGDHYFNLRDLMQQYMERFFGRGIITRDQSVVYRRWENEDGTMEVSFSDKYLRVFVRLGKQ